MRSVFGMILTDRRLWILTIWAAAFIGLAITNAADNGGILVGILFLMMPAVTAFPSACKFLFQPLSAGLLVFVIILFAAVWAIVAWRTGRIADYQALMVLTPVYQLAVVGGAYRVFVLVFDRDPVDVALNFSDGLGWDRFFVIVTLLLALLVPINIYWAIP